MKRRAIIGTVAILTLGVGAGVIFTRFVRGHEDVAQTELRPLRVGEWSLRFPTNTRVERVEDGAHIISWAPPNADRTRCGVRANASVRATDLPTLRPSCHNENLFEGGSSDGECPRTLVCVARRDGVELECHSDDDTCTAVTDALFDP